MMTLEQVWQELQPYEGEGSRSFDLSGMRVQFYKGAMEIPMVAFYPARPLALEEDKLQEYSQLIASFGFELDCVSEGNNYKINRSSDGQYLGRITLQALKLHAIRAKELGWGPFNKMVSFHLTSALS